MLYDKLNFDFIRDTAPVAASSHGGQFSDTGLYSLRVYCLHQSQTRQGQFYARGLSRMFTPSAMA